jgi:small multidrug resistance pump
MPSWGLLTAAILCEVAATMSLKLSEGFTRLVPSTVVIVGYLCSFFLLSQILARGLSIGIVYAVWSAVGVALIVLLDVLLFDERLTTVQVFGLFAVVVGVMALELGGTAS